MPMIYRFIKATVLIALLASLTTLGGCNKANRTTTTAKDIAVGEALISDLWRVAHQFIIFSQFTGGQQQSVLDSTLSYCFEFDPVPPRSASNTIWPRNIAVDFGSGCDELDGRDRKGKINIELTNWWEMANTQTTITTEGYFVDGNSVQGTMVLTYTGFAGGLVLAEVSDFSINSSGGGFTQIKNNFTRTLSEGFPSRTVVGNDLYVITGSIEGVNNDGDAFSAQTVTPVFYQNGCPYMKQGQIEIFPADGDSRILDFGEGECDPNFSVNIDGRYFHDKADHF